ncbi:MAG: hypothetical protein IID45_07595 [Planctomycetes bacterium]|nr:hypothetical protein [Planctomycetota bacterium]
MLGILPDESAISQVWFFLSLPLILAVYFRFGRVWSLRNLDLGLLLLLAFAVILTEAGALDRTGVLFLGIGVLLLRLLSDVFLHKRPRIDSNLTPPGLILLALTGFGLIVAETSQRPPDAVAGDAVTHGERIINRQAEPTDEKSKTTTPATTPTPALLGGPVAYITDRITPGGENAGASDARRKSQRDESVRITAARILAILSHLLVVSALIFLGVSLFQHAKSGIAMAALYCLLPCTIIVPASVQYVLPIGFILWALAAHRRPVISGILLALACGTHVFPLFLLPIWLAYYGRKRRFRFSMAFIASVAALLGSVTLDAGSFLAVSKVFMGYERLLFVSGDGRWSWMYANTIMHVLSVVAVVILIAGLTVWPTKKTPEHLVVHTTIVIAAISFWYSWYSQQIGQYLPSLLPMVILVAYRPGTLTERLKRRLTPPIQQAAFRTPEGETALHAAGARSSLFR